MDKDIRGGREAQQCVPRPRLFQVEDDTLLVAVYVEVIGRHPRVSRRTDAAHHLAFGRLDLDDFRAEIAEDLGRHRPQHRDRQIDDADPSQRSRHVHLLIRRFLALNRRPGESRDPPFSCLGRGQVGPGLRRDDGSVLTSRQKPSKFEVIE